MDPKLLIVVVVFLVLLFAAGVSMGFTVGGDGGGGGGFSPSWVTGLGDMMVREKALGAKDVDSADPADCLERLRQGRLELAQGQRCHLTIAPSRERVRTVSLRLDQGSAAELRFDPRGRGLTAKEGLDPSQREAEMRIFEEGGALEIVCTDAGERDGCRFAMQQ